MEAVEGHVDDERAAQQCSFLQEHGRHDDRVQPNQVIAGGEVVIVRVLCAACRRPDEKRARRTFRNINPADPNTWRPWVDD